jgi:hypothetical protein
MRHGVGRAVRMAGKYDGKPSHRKYRGWGYNYVSFIGVIWPVTIFMRQRRDISGLVPAIVTASCNRSGGGLVIRRGIAEGNSPWPVSEPPQPVGAQGGWSRFCFSKIAARPCNLDWRDAKQPRPSAAGAGAIAESRKARFFCRPVDGKKMRPNFPSYQLLIVNLFSCSFSRFMVSFAMVFIGKGV